MKHSSIRARWAAVGAAVAVSLGAGGLGLAHAASGSGERSVFVPIDPCRLFDTRPDSQVGPRATPLAPEETTTIAATGTVGDCALPDDATGLVMNVTALGATQPTYLTFWPAGGERPTASSLNPVPGAAPTPNAVTTDLNDAGEFSIYNRAGSVHVLADVVGYYVDHHHDDRYYTKPQSDERYYTQTQSDATHADLSASIDDLEAALDSNFNRRLSPFYVAMNVGDEPQVLASVGPLVYTAHCELDGTLVVGRVTATSTEGPWYLWNSEYQAGQAAEVESDDTRQGDPDWREWFHSIFVPSAGILDTGYGNMILLEYPGANCVFAGNVMPTAS